MVLVDLVIRCTKWGFNVQMGQDSACLFTNRTASVESKNIFSLQAYLEQGNEHTIALLVHLDLGHDLAM